MFLLINVMRVALLVADDEYVAPGMSWRRSPVRKPEIDHFLQTMANRGYDP